MRQLVRKDNEAYAIQRNMRVSPSKANAVLEMIRGKKASEALNLLKFSSRGVAMNPIDHPHGGGEGKTSGGRDPVTPWGKPTKGKKPRNNKRTDKFIIKRKTDKKARIEV